jgi:hypothetical protein
MSFTSASAVSQSRWRDVRISAVARGASIGGDMLTATALLLVLQERGLGGWAVAALPMLRAARRERARAASAADAEADAGVVAEVDAAVVAEAGAPVPAVASAT